MALTKAKASNILLTTPAASSNDTTPATTQYVTTAVANLIDNAPANLNTLNELAAAMADNASFFSTVLPLSGGTMTGNLTVSGTAANTIIESTGSWSILRLKAPNTNGGYIQFADADDDDVGQIFYYHGSGGDYMSFTANAAERMRIDSNGNVGIGSVNPTRHLTLYKAGSTQTQVQFQNGDTGQTSTDGFSIGMDNGKKGFLWGYDDQDIYMGSSTNGTQLYIDNANQRIGIGITSGLDRNLHIKGSNSDVGIQIEKTGVGELRVAYDSTGPYLYAENTSHPLRIYTGGAQNFIFTQNGDLNVGRGVIATSNSGSNPAYALNWQNDAIALEMKYDANYLMNIEFDAATRDLILTSSTNDATANIKFRTSGSGASSLADRMTIDHVGNVGIGTVNPKRMLQVGNNTQAIAAISLQAATTGKSRIYMGDNDATAAEYSGLISYDHNVGNLEVWSGGGNRMTILGTSQSNTHVDIHGGANVGIGNTNAAGDTGINVKGWYNASGHSSNTYLHLNTSLWAGGSPHGNNMYIMGGWKVVAHQYATNNSYGQCTVFFHNWSGSVASGFSQTYGPGPWTGWMHVYVNSSGYVTVRLAGGTYRAYWLDLYQAPHYTVRNIYVTAATFSNSATL